MQLERFRETYEGVPIATFTRDYKKHTRTFNYETISNLHREMEILLVLEGEAILHTDTETRVIRKGDMVLLSPYTLHRYTLPADRDFKHYCLCFDLDILYNKELAFQIESHRLLIPTVLSGDTRCAAYVEEAYRTCAERNSGWELTAVGQLSLLFGALQERGILQKCEQPLPQSVYFQIYEYIARHFSEPITSADLAKTLGFNNSYVCRLFKKSFGECFQNYLCVYRLEKSKQLLAHSNTSVSQIALDVGFHSFSYYSKKFKEYNGISPTAYRKRHT